MAKTLELVEREALKEAKAGAESINSYASARRYLDRAARFGSRYGLEVEQELLRRLGNPQDKLRIVHVAGTNGKGSVCAYLASILNASGFRTGRYISPVLFGYRERIQIDGLWISREQVQEHTKKIADAVQAMKEEGWEAPTVFEMETAMAYLEFWEKQCDIAVIETGLGGRLDATNVIRWPELGILTSIGMDHRELLGDTLEAIANEKCGIIKPGMKVLSAAQRPEAEEAIRRACQRLGNPVRFLEPGRMEELRYTLQGTYWEYQDQNGVRVSFHTKLLGAYQPENAMVAVAAARWLGALGSEISWDAVRRGVEQAVWPGRFGVVCTEPLVLVDGAHNEDGAKQLRRSEEIYFGGRPVTRVIGVFADKDYDAVLRETLQPHDTVYTIKPPGPRGLDAEILAEHAKKYCRNVQAVCGLFAALDKICGTTVIYGSLSFLGEVYRYFAPNAATIRTIVKEK